MTDLRDLLAAALREHRDRHGMCSVEHDVDVLLSLPGIDIVELPELTPGQWLHFGEISMAPEAPNCLWVQGYPTPMWPTAARALAAHLLAAAKLWEEKAVQNPIA